MSEPAVLVERDNDVVVITLNRPAKRNAVDGPTATALREALEGFAADDSLRVAVLAGVSGNAVAGGLELALFCDIRVADEAIPGARRFAWGAGGGGRFE